MRAYCMRGEKRPARWRTIMLLVVAGEGEVLCRRGGGRTTTSFGGAWRRIRTLLLLALAALLASAATVAEAWCGFQHPEDCLFVLRRTAASEERAIVFKDANGTVSGALALTSSTSFGFYVGAGVEPRNRVLEFDASGNKIVAGQSEVGEVEIFGGGSWRLLRRAGSVDASKGDGDGDDEPAELVLQLVGGSAASPQAVDHCDNMAVGSVLFRSQDGDGGEERSAGIRTLAVSESGAAGSHVGGESK